MPEQLGLLYDIYSNIHYGDLITMHGGAALLDKYGPNMTAEQFHTGLIDIINQLDAAKQAGKSVPQIAYLP